MPPFRLCQPYQFDALKRALITNYTGQQTLHKCVAILDAHNRLAATPKIKPKTPCQLSCKAGVDKEDAFCPN
jgi:hypothetical protein